MTDHDALIQRIADYTSFRYESGKGWPTTVSFAELRFDTAMSYHEWSGQLFDETVNLNVIPLHISIEGKRNRGCVYSRVCIGISTSDAEIVLRCAERLREIVGDVELWLGDEQVDWEADGD